ncbi:ion transporter [Chryseosolibacter indicus]|uniref:Ion transporter n=1 Tax=Chryseosolibacter indicus TaxID=2782351 RepID=A0ABS5VU51_9BACT|nr:ion transporter [Chryseosolibacter indicus]MBT1703516.1 ion transporter [Chryseosolibacter indicus]
MAPLRKRVYNLLEPSVSNSRASRVIELLLITLIFLNILAIVLESVKDVNAEYHHVFKLLENVSVLIFTIEYILRIWTSAENPKYRFKKRYYIFSGMAVIDFLSILPFYLELVVGFVPIDLLFLRIIRLFRLFRVLKIARYLKALNIMQAVLRERKEQIFVSIMFILFLLLVVSTLMFYAENEAQPTKFSSIPATMWWGIETLTTVGYGDLVPITTYGKILGGMISILGIGLFALPAGIFSSGLTEHLYKSNKKKFKHCPHCGEELDM